MSMPLQQQVTQFWTRQSRSQRATMVVLIAAAVILIVFLVAWASTPNYATVYSGLGESDAGQIVDKLTELNIPYRLQGGGTIQVPSDQVYETRLKMAKEGLPQDSSTGFEIFSGNTFGMTEFTQRVNYQRALEGELERTIGSLAAVEAVRVHVVTPEKTLLMEQQPPTTASVTIQIAPGKRLDQSQVQSITHLVGSSVEGLTPENVVIVDTAGNLLAAGTGENADAGFTSQTDSQRSIEMAAAQEIKNKTQTLLDAVLGPNSSVVQASVIMDWTQRETTSITYDPTPAAIRSSQSLNETYTTNGENLAGVPGAETNLPTPAPTQVGGEGGLIYERNEETVNYEITQVQSHEIASPGQISRISLSVLVDGISDPQQLQVIKGAVAAAAGIDEARGDTLSVETLNFDRTYYETQTAELEQSSQMDQYIRIGTYAAAALLLIALFWYISRLLRNLRMASAETWTAVMKPVSEASLNAPHAMNFENQMAAGGRIAENVLSQPGVAAPTPPQPVQQPAFFAPPSPPQPVMTAEDEQMHRALERLADENPASVAEIIQLWLSEEDKNG